jgi:hypothetical protein
MSSQTFVDSTQAMLSGSSSGNASIVSSDPPANNALVVSSEASVEATQDALAAISLVDPESLEGVCAFLKKRKEIDVVRHFTSNSLPGAPAILGNAI